MNNFSGTEKHAFSKIYLIYFPSPHSPVIFFFLRALPSSPPQRPRPSSPSPRRADVPARGIGRRRHLVSASGTRRTNLVPLRPPT